MADPEFVDAPAPEFVDDPPPRSQANFGLGLRAMLQMHAPRSQADFGLGLRTTAQIGALGAGLVAGGPLLSAAVRFLTRGTPSADTAQRTAHGAGEAFQAGIQGSSGGLLYRGQLPSVVLDAHHASTFERLASMAGNVIGDLPAMVTGFAAGAAAGIESGPGALAVGGAAGMAVPTAIRQALVQAYSLDQVQSAGDFLNQTAISIKETGKSAIIGGATGLAGPMASGLVGSTAPNLVKAGVGLTAEYGTMAVAPALLDFRLPEKHDFLDAAVMMGGFKAAHVVSGKLMEVYRRTGKTPIEVMADARQDPTILEDLARVLDAELPEASKRTNIVFKRELSAKEAVDTRAFEIQDGNGQWFGGGLVDEGPGFVRVRNIGIDKPEYMGQGRGVEAYQELADGALASGKVFRSDSEVSPDAQRIYEALERRGYTVEKNPNAVLGEDGKLSVKRGSVFTVTGGAPEANGIPRAYKPLANRMAAEDAVPGLAQEVVKEFYGPTVEIPGEPKPTTVNYNYINSSDNVKGAMERISQLNVEHIQTQRRGTQTMGEIQAAAGQWLRQNIGEGAEVTGREPGTAANAGELLARKQLAEGSANRMGEMADALLRLPPDATPGAIAAAEAELVASIHRSAAITAEFLGARAETARAFRALQETSVSAERAAQLQDILQREGTGSVKELAEKIKALDSPEAAVKFARKVSQATTWDMVIEAWKSALVSGPITQTANVMGNTSFAALRPAVDATAALFGRITGAKERVLLVEPVAGMIGGLHSVMDGLKVAAEAIKTEGVGGKAEHKQAIPGTAGKVIRTPFRLLSGVDAFFRVMNEQYEAYSLAAREASAEGHNPATREFRERVAELAANPTEKMLDRIEEAGTRYTFNAPLGEKGRAVNNLVRKWHLEWAVPFISTPGNVFKEMARLTPAAPIIGEWRADFAAGGPRAQKAMAEMAVGTGLAAATVGMALAGYVSGSGDPDPNKRRVQLASGWQPYSVKVNGTWYSYQRMQPVGTLLGMAADMAEVWEHMTPEESDKIPKILGTAFANAVTNQTFLQGIAQLFAAISHPDRDMARFLNSIAASTVPAVLGQTAQLMDPYQREIDGLLDAVQNRIPGLREGLQPQRDPFGAAVPSPDRILGVTPVATKNQSVDPVYLEAARLGIGVAKAPKSVNIPAGPLAGDLAKVPLTPEQRDYFATASGQLAHQILSEIVGGPGWEEMPKIQKAEVFDTVMERARSYANATVISPEQREKEVQRIVGGLQDRLGKPDRR